MTTTTKTAIALTIALLLAAPTMAGTVTHVEQLGSVTTTAAVDYNGSVGNGVVSVCRMYVSRITDATGDETFALHVRAGGIYYKCLVNDTTAVDRGTLTELAYAVREGLEFSKDSPKGSVWTEDIVGASADDELVVLAASKVVGPISVRMGEGLHVTNGLQAGSAKKLVRIIEDALALVDDDAPEATKTGRKGSRRGTVK